MNPKKGRGLDQLVPEGPEHVVVIPIVEPIGLNTHVIVHFKQMGFPELIQEICLRFWKVM